jgi:helicase
MLHTGWSCVLHMPTGSGKTWLAEQAIASVLTTGARAIYLTPLRALATELTAKWRRQFSSSTVGIFTGDYGATGKPYPVPFQEAHLLVMTPERLDACTRMWRSHWSWIPQVDLVVVDELHLLGDRLRGARLEGALSRFRRLNPFTRFLGLSATLGNCQELATWFDGIAYTSTWRPIPIQWRVVRYRKADEKPARLLEEVRRNTHSGGKSLVFVQSRRRAEALSHFLESSGLPVAHHHAGLPHPERRRVEEGFRNTAIEVLVATSTLEMGVNLPARQVVLYDLQTFDGTDFQPLSMNSVWQRIGRAGRPGLDPAGEAVLLAPVWDRSVDRYAKGEFEPIHSGLSEPRALAEQIVAEVASGLARTTAQLTAVFRQSLAFQQNTLPDVGKILATMCEAEIVREVPDDEHEAPQAFPRLQATRFGRIAVRHLLAPDTVVRLRRVLCEYQDLSFFDLLLTAASTDDCEPVLPVDFEELDTLASDVAEERSVLLACPHSEIAHALGIAGKRLLASLKMALVARVWTRTADAQRVAEQYQCYPFEVARLCESLDRLLLAIVALFETAEEGEQPVVDPDTVSVQERVVVLRQMVAAGLDESAVTLTCVPGIGATLAKRLYAAGIEDIEHLALAEPAEVAAVRGVSQKRARQWILAAEDLVRTCSAWRYREAGPTHHLYVGERPREIDPYRLRRALDLRVNGSEAGIYRVTGGLDPHLVHFSDQKFSCDCADANRGTVCKHMLAVRLARGDRTVKRLARQLRTPTSDCALNVFALWIGNDRPAREGRKPCSPSPVHFVPVAV